jgi:acylphosphatase
MSEAPRRFRATVTGRVQGVGYRASTLSRAERLGIQGWVRNRYDGAVEVEAEGPAEAMAQFETFLWKGPAGARVDHVDIESMTSQKTASDDAMFRIRKTE